MRYLHGVALTLLLIICCSCVNLRYPAAGGPVLLRDDTSLVFGRVQVIEDDVDVTRDYCDPRQFFSPADKLLSFTLLELGSRKVSMNAIAEVDGSFYWILPAGFYRIINIQYRTDVDPYLAFKVEGGGKYLYIGNIVVRAESSLAKADISTAYELKDIDIEDNGEYEANIVNARFPGHPHVIEKSLIFTNYDK